MDATELLAILETWSCWDAPPSPSIPRNVTLPDALRDTLCLVVQGVRRCGKSTLLRQLIGRYALNPLRCAFINLEDPRLSNSLTFPLLDEVVAVFRGMHPETETLYFFLDEIQAVVGWERWLRSKLDRPQGDHFIITGSNATLLSGELGTVLTGRHLTVELFPFDLQERRLANPSLPLADYLLEGGFPEPVFLSDGDRLLRQYFEDIIARDVRERVAARSARPIRQVVQMAYEAAGSELSLRRIAGAAGLAVETAAAYLEAAEAAYLLFSVPYFAYSERKRANRNRKYYPIDPALRRVTTSRAGADQGKSLECAVFLALRRRFGRDVSYWRGAGEVDFVVQQGNRVVPIQVTWSAPEPRHYKALEAFYEAFPQAAEAVFITADTFDELDEI